MGANVAIFFNVYVCILLASFAAKDALEESLRHQKKRKKTNQIKSWPGSTSTTDSQTEDSVPRVPSFFLKSFNNNNK